ncbi:MAG: nucleoside triphosphate pyrophosphatase [Pseudomonadota bacterium]|nr:nucleoside triphosphate pyrophosphatase [Pseudomonadota bacterium]
MTTSPADAAPLVVLASKSAARAAMLSGAGVVFGIDSADVDEAGARDFLGGENADIASATITLAGLKATTVAARHPGALVIGADQILACDGRWFDKPADRAPGRSHLLALRGREHRLFSGVCLVCDGATLWTCADQAVLTMRSFSDEFLDAYLADAGEGILGCVGAYQLEGLGAQLFSAVEGDYFTVLGLPLLPLLEALRGHGVIVQ